MNTVAIRKDWVGRTIDGRFTLLEWLGGSEAGAVFLTEFETEPNAEPDKARSRKTAIKLLPAEDGDAEARLARWSAATKLSHPHLLRLLHAGRCQLDETPLLYAVTEYAEENLSQILPERPLTPGETGEMLVPVLDALAYLHGQGFVHARLKPSNILAVDDQIKISSDSLEAVGERAQHSPPGIYEAPELSYEAVSPAADLWSLGVALVEALTQHPPVWDESPQREPAVPESVPEPFAAIARDCLRSDPRLRCKLGEIRVRLDPGSAEPAGREPSRLEPDCLEPPSLEPSSLEPPGLEPPRLEPTRPEPPRLEPDRVEAGPLQLDSLEFDRPEPARAPREPYRASRNEAPRKLPITALVAMAIVLVAVVIVALLLRSRPAQPRQSIASQPPAADNPAPSAPAPDHPARHGVTQKGAVADQVLPDILPSARDSIHGRVAVSVRVAVDPTGAVSSAEFGSAGPSKYFARKALEAAQHWKFTPAQVDGQPVSSVWVLKFAFRTTGTEVKPIESTP